jgi:hypothetical protein
MKQTILLLSLVILTITSVAQGIINNGASLTASGDSYWVVDGGSFTLTGSGSGSANPNNLANLRITNDASLAINAGSSLTVTGTITNDAGTTGLVIKSDATGDASYIGPAAQTTVERYLTASAWHLLSSPVAAATNSLYTGMYMKQYNETTNAFGPLIIATTTPLTPGTGSVVWATAASTVSYTGATNAGTSLSAPYTNQGFTLAGNPFPSFLDWNADSGWTKTNIAGTIWVWDPSLNSGAGNYTYFNSTTGGTGIRYLAPGQGFFIQAAPGGGSLAVSSGAQVHQQPEISLRSAQAAPELMNIRVFNDVYSDQALIAMIPDALPSYDYRYDAWKMAGPEITPQLSAFKDGKQLSIASFNQIDSTMQIPLSLKAGTTGTWSLSINNGIYLGELKIFLLDKILNTATRMDDQSTVSITAATADISDRFTILFSARSVITGTVKTEDNHGTIRIWNAGRKLNIEIPSNEQLVTVEIYNLNGIKVKSITSGSLRDIDLSLNTGMYVVRVKTTKQVKTNKIVLY